MHTVASIAGWVGAVTVLAGYGLVVSKRWSAADVRYLIANVVGAAGLGLSAAQSHAWQSTTVNVLWLVLGAGPLVQAVRARRSRPRASV